MDKVKTYSSGFETLVVYLDKDTPFPDIKPFKRVIVFGGDGTLNSFLNSEKISHQELFYYPIGTLNESAKTSKNSISECLSVNDKKVAYVCACGIFTPLGYNTKTRTKKRIKALAYIFNVIKEYKIQRINANILFEEESELNQGLRKNFEHTLESKENKNAHHNQKTLNGEFSLIMCIKSKICFGFKFNKLYKSQDGFELLSIKSPKHNGLLGKIELFFPLFRCFFIGFKNNFESKNITFKKVYAAKISLDKKTTFCLDGEKADFNDEISVNTTYIEDIQIIN